MNTNLIVTALAAFAAGAFAMAGALLALMFRGERRYRRLMKRVSEINGNGVRRPSD